MPVAIDSAAAAAAARATPPLPGWLRIPIHEQIKQMALQTPVEYAVLCRELCKKDRVLSFSKNANVTLNFLNIILLEQWCLC